MVSCDSHERLINWISICLIESERLAKTVMTDSNTGNSLASTLVFYETLWNWRHMPNETWFGLSPIGVSIVVHLQTIHDDVIKWKHFPRYWPFVRGIHRSPANSPHKGQWRGALMFSLICVWINGWVSNREAGDLRRNLAHYDVIVMKIHPTYIFPGGRNVKTSQIPMFLHIAARIWGQYWFTQTWKQWFYVQN